MRIGARFVRRLEQYEAKLALGLLIAAAAVSVFWVARLWAEAGAFIEAYGAGAAFEPTLAEALSAYSAAGDFLNLRFGVSVAVVSGVLGGAIALILTYFAMKAARRQGDIQLLEFVEERTRSLRKLQPLLTGALKSLNVPTNLLIEKLDDVRRAAIQVQRESPELSLSEIIENDDRFAEYRALVDAYQVCVDGLAQITVQAGEDHYVEAFAQRRVRNASPAENPFLFLQKTLPLFSRAGMLDDYVEIASDLSDLLERIRYLTKVTKPFEPILAYEACLEKYTTLTFAGALLHHQTVDLSRIEDVREGDIIDVSVNYGAALLIWLVRILHVNNDDIIGLYRDLFASRAGTLAEYLNAVPIYAGATDSWLERFQDEASRVFRRRFHLSHATISMVSLAA